MEDFVGIPYIQQNSALLFEYILFGVKVITLVERNVFETQFVARFILFNLLIIYDKFTLNSYAPLLWCLIFIHLSFAYCELPIAVVEIEWMSCPTGQSCLTPHSVNTTCACPSIPLSTLAFHCFDKVFMPFS